MAKRKRKKKAAVENGVLVVAKHRSAWHEYNVLEKLEVGMALLGSEVKSLRNHAVDFADSYCRVIDDELYVIGLHISEYKQAGINNHDPTRKRKLLAHKREIRKLKIKAEQRGMTIVPLLIYFRNGRAKMEIGLCSGKSRYDKRRALKEKMVKRDMDREMRRR